jgi:hypothetical protein
MEVIQDSQAMWETTPLTTRIVIALAVAGLGVYLGSRAERSGTSAVLFFVAFGFFAYVIAMGIRLVQ